jgi:hypothetical protein
MTTVTFTGRVASVLDGALLLQDASGAVWVDASDHASPPVGAWVELEGIWDGSRVRDALATTLNAPTQPFPAAGGDWRWLMDQGG